MKSSKIIVEKGKSKEEYNIILKVEAMGDEYILYTNGETDESGEVIAYAGKYELKDDKQVIIPIEEDYILEFLDSILLHIQSKINSKENGSCE